MPSAHELLVSLAVALVVLVLFVLVRARVKRNRTPQRTSARGPANLSFTCAGCEEQFTHTKRTLGAWEKGTRRFFCNACHTKWRASHPTQPVQGTGIRAVARPPYSSRSEESAHSAGSHLHSHSANRPPRAASGSGCLGAALLLIAIPIALVVAIVQYA